MAQTSPYHNSDAGFLGGNDVHSEDWRVTGHLGTMVDTSPDGPLSPAVHDRGVDAAPGSADASSGAHDGAAASQRSADRLAWHAENAGYDIEGPEGVNSPIT